MTDTTPSAGWPAILILGRDTCEDTTQARAHLDARGIPYDYRRVDREPDADVWIRRLNDDVWVTPTILTAIRSHRTRSCESPRTTSSTRPSLRSGPTELFRAAWLAAQLPSRRRSMAWMAASFGANSLRIWMTDARSMSSSFAISWSVSDSCEVIVSSAALTR